MLSVCLWMCLVISRIANYYEISQISIEEMLFIPCTLTEEGWSRFAVCRIWEQHSHLRPDLQHRLQRSRRSRTAIVSSCYWLMLLAGVIKLNPGPQSAPGATPPPNFQIIHLNVRSLPGHLDEVTPIRPARTSWPSLRLGWTRVLRTP